MKYAGARDPTHGLTHYNLCSHPNKSNSQTQIVFDAWKHLILHEIYSLMLKMQKCVALNAWLRLKYNKSKTGCLEEWCKNDHNDNGTEFPEF